MVDEGWFDPAEPAQTPVELTAQLPVPIALPEQRSIGVVECPERTSCATCGRPLYEGIPVRPAHDPQEVPFDCLTCWWRAELDLARAAVR